MELCCGVSSHTRWHNLNPPCDRLAGLARFSGSTSMVRRQFRPAVSESCTQCTAPGGGVRFPVMDSLAALEHGWCGGPAAGWGRVPQARPAARVAQGVQTPARRSARACVSVCVCARVRICVIHPGCASGTEIGKPELDSSTAARRGDGGLRIKTTFIGPGRRLRTAGTM